MSIFQTIVNKYKDAKQKSLNKKDFKKALLQAVNDGKITKEEIDELDKKKSEFGLTDEDVKGMRAEIFAAAFSATKEDQQVTKDEEQELEKIQKFLGLADDEIQHNKKRTCSLASFERNPARQYAHGTSNEFDNAKRRKSILD